MKKNQKRTIETCTISKKSYEPPSATLVSLKQEETHTKRTMSPNCRDCTEVDWKYLK